QAKYYHSAEYRISGRFGGRAACGCRFDTGSYSVSGEVRGQGEARARLTAETGTTTSEMQAVWFVAVPDCFHRRANDGGRGGRVHARPFSFSLLHGCPPLK